MNVYNEQNASSEVVTDDSEQQNPEVALGEVPPLSDVGAAADSRAANDAPVDAGDRVWDSLKHVGQELVAYNLAPAMLVPHLRNRDLIAKVTDKSTLVRNAELLQRDVVEFRNRLANIASKHQDRTGSSVDADDQLAAIQVNEEYIQWAESYDSVVMPTVCAMIEPLLDAGAALDVELLTKKTTDVVEQPTSDDDSAVDAGSMSETSHD